MKKLASRNFWQELIAMRDLQREQKKTAVQLVKRSQLPQEKNPMGRMRWYLHPGITDTLCSTFLFFEQEIPPGNRSGRLKFQGGQVMVIVGGKGHTLIDGVKYSWEKGDVVNLPLKRNGIVIQHVNDSNEEPARFIAVEPNWFACTGVDRGSGFELLEEASESRT